jgi:hypothetical protein
VHEGVAHVGDGREGAWEKHHWLAEELVGVLVEAREGRTEREVQDKKR